MIALCLACWLAPTAAAVELPAAGQVTGTVTSQVPEGPVKDVADTAVKAVPAVEAPVHQTVQGAASQAPASPALPAVPAPALPATPALADELASAQRPAPQAAGKRPAARINTARVERPAPRGERLRATIAAPAELPTDPRPPAAAAPSDGRTAGTAHGSAPARAASPSPQEERPGGPDRPGPALGAAAAPAASSAFFLFFFGGLALLAGGVLLAAPQLSRRLVTRPASWRPVGLVLLLERPG